MNLSAGVAIHLLGRPRIEIDGDAGYRFRSRKSWALLTFLLLAERPPTRSRLASLLFAEADDPLRALRWCLAEVRRGLGPGSRGRRRPGPADAAAGGDGRRRRAGPRPLERRGPAPGTRPGPARRADDRQRGAVRVVAAVPASAPLGRDRVHRPRGGARAAGPRRARACARPRRPGDRDESAGREPPGVPDPHLPSLRRRRRGRSASTTPGLRPPSASSAPLPGAAVLLATQERPASEQAVDAVSIHAVTEGGAAAVSAGALVAGVASFEAAVRMADQSGVDERRASRPGWCSRRR